MAAPNRPPGEQSGAEPESGVAASRSAMRPQAPAEDTSFMEEILLELSAQNEQARSNGGLRRARREAASKRSDPPAATEKQATVHVPRDGAFRTAEGTPSARAYLPAKTLAPNPSGPIEIATVKVSDPRRLPTVRVPRHRSARGVGSSLPVSPDESVPTLRSGGPGAPSPTEAPTISARPIHAAWWVASLTLVAIAAVIVLLIAVRALG